MSITFKNIGSFFAASENHKEPVSTTSALPTLGNTDGDLRIVIDVDKIYAWDATTATWKDVTGNAFTTVAVPNGTSPVADSTSDTLTLTSSDNSVSINGDSVTDSVDIILSNNIPGNKTFSGTVSLNGAENTGLSATIVLTDNTTIATTAFSFPKSFETTVIEYSMSRDSNRRSGRLLIINNGLSVSIVDDFHDLLGSIGVDLSATVSGSNINVQYVTSNTGFNANFKYIMRRWAI